MASLSLNLPEMGLPEGILFYDILKTAKRVYRNETSENGSLSFFVNIFV